MQNRLQRRRNWSRNYSLHSAASPLRIPCCSVIMPALRRWLSIETLSRKLPISPVCPLLCRVPVLVRWAMSLSNTDVCTGTCGVGNVAKQYWWYVLIFLLFFWAFEISVILKLSLIALLLFIQFQMRRELISVLVWLYKSSRVWCFLLTINLVPRERWFLTACSFIFLFPVSGFDLAWFSSLSSKRLCVFGLNGAV